MSRSEMAQWQRSFAAMPGTDSGSLSLTPQTDTNTTVSVHHIYLHRGAVGWTVQQGWAVALG